MIKEVLYDFKDVLNFSEFSNLSRLNVIHNQDTIVKNMHFALPYREQLIELNEITVGGARINYTFLC